MSLPASGIIKMSDINVELLRSSTAAISLAGTTDMRALAGKPTGSISMSDFLGKTYVFYATISTNQQQINLATLATSLGWNEIFPVVVTINAGVYIWSDSTSIAALTTGTFPRGLTIINNGYIMGKGGAGGYATSATGANLTGKPGGPAISLGATTVINMAGTTSYIGGGGGGGAGMPNSGGEIYGGGGGGAGGGSGGQSYQARGGFLLGNEGAGGAIGLSGGNGTGQSGGTSIGGGAGGGGGAYNLDGISSTRDGGSSGAGGGRIFPGVGGAGANSDGDGGAGGSAGAAGGNGYNPGSDHTGAGGGGGWGAAGGYASNPNYTYYGGAGGKAIALNGYTATLQGATTRIYGAIS